MNCNLSNQTKKNTNFRDNYKKAHLGHVLRQQTPMRDALEYIVTPTPVKKQSNPPNNIKPYNKDLGTKKLRNRYTMVYRYTIFYQPGIISYTCKQLFDYC